MVSQSVLVLNRNWNAIHVCSVKRAIGLVFQDLAHVVTEDYRTFDFNTWTELSRHMDEHGNEFIRTPSMRVLVPEVIILRHFNRMPPRTIKFNRKNIYIRDSHTCQYCGAKPPKEQLTIDHVLPRSRGGRSTWENVVLACQDCNSRKGDRLLPDLPMKLSRKPKRPSWFAAMRSSLGKPDKPIWSKFVDAAYWNVPLEE